MKDKPLKERIREILEEVEEHGAIPFKGEKKYLPHSTVAQALQAILNEIKENLLKEERKDKKDCIELKGYKNGWNAYHDEMMRRLE